MGGDLLLEVVDVARGVVERRLGAHGRAGERRHEVGVLAGQRLEHRHALLRSSPARPRPAAPCQAPSAQRSAGRSAPFFPMFRRLLCIARPCARSPPNAMGSVGWMGAMSSPAPRAAGTG